MKESKLCLCLLRLVADCAPWMEVE